jgi:hypothetical protein
MRLREHQTALTNPNGGANAGHWWCAGEWRMRAVFHWFKAMANLKFYQGMVLAGLLAAPALRLSAAETAWQRVVVIGASASSGFVLSEPFGGTNTDQCRLSRYLDAAIIAPHAPLKNYATAALFLSPEALATQEVEAATNQRPTLVIAVDFLFWFCYGPGQTDADRAQRFETGLKLLERIPCPLVVGDIPDASRATNSGIISPAQVPSEPARVAANQRLRDWAKHRRDVTLVPLDQFMKCVEANQAIEKRHVKVPAGRTHGLLQNDRLHPTPQGAALLALGILDEYSRSHQTVPETDVRWNLEEVFRKGNLAPRL